MTQMEFKPHETKRFFLWQQTDTKPKHENYQLQFNIGIHLEERSRFIVRFSFSLRLQEKLAVPKTTTTTQGT